MKKVPNNSNNNLPQLDIVTETKLSKMTRITMLNVIMLRRDHPFMKFKAPVAGTLNIKVRTNGRTQP